MGTLEPRRDRAPAVRISDADRNVAIELLRQHCGEGLLTLDEFGERVALVFDAKTRGELEQVMADLPSAYQQVPETRRRRVTRWAVAILGGHSPRGRIRLADTTNAIAVMGGCELDLRRAEIAGDEVVINCFALMGGIDIIVPEGIQVDFSGLPLLGGTDCKINPDVPIIPGSPRIIVRAVAIMGGVSVRSRKSPEAEQAERDGRRADRLRRRAEQLERRGNRTARHLDEAFEALELAREITERASGHPRSRNRHSPRSMNVGPAIERVARAVEAEWPQLRERAAPDGTVTIMFSDIESFTELTERLGDRGAREVLREHNEIVRKSVAEHGGYEVKSQGDGFMVAFGGASRALRCATDIQRKLEGYNERAEEPIRVRMGLHTGEAIREKEGAGTDFLGRCVITASRIANEADGGEILVSSVLRELTSATGEFEFADARQLELKGISAPQAVSALVW